LTGALGGHPGVDSRVFFGTVFIVIRCLCLFIFLLLTDSGDGPIFGCNSLRVRWPSSIINMVLLTYNVNITISLRISLGVQGLKLGRRICSDLLAVEGQVCSV
ncbi:hypothetical protein B0H14DRAFT_2735067, partial [Mycena olivaceomarginata]